MASFEASSKVSVDSMDGRADPDGRLYGWPLFLEGELRDGTGQVGGKRIFALYRSVCGDVRLVSPSVLWASKPYAEKQEIQS